MHTLLFDLSELCNYFLQQYANARHCLTQFANAQATL